MAFDRRGRLLINRPWAGGYLATLSGADSETALRWFVLVVSLLLGPAAVLLLLAASARR